MKLKYTVLFIFAVIFTGFAVFHSIATYRMAERSAEDFLNSNAFFIGITLHQALNRTGLDEQLFRDISRSQLWDEIAFMALYDVDGRLLLHSDRGTVDIKTISPDVRKLIKDPEPATSYIKLETGKSVYVMDMPVNIVNFSPAVHILRIALHTGPAQAPLKHAKVHALTALFIIVFLWILSFGIVRYSKRVIDMHMKDVEKRHFTMLGEMAAILAHEIRTPLSAIKGFAQLINEKEGNSASTEEGLGVIIGESQRLERLTEDLLIYARTGEVHAEEFTLTSLVDEVDGIFNAVERSVSITKKITMKNDLLNTDREKLKQVFINIMQNALDSIEDSGSIKIRASDSTHVINISFKDSGRGMDKETLRNAFRPFFTSKAKGTGLGLAIVDNLMKTLKGSFSIESEPERGTEVMLSIQRNII